jgi:hypothetical protein
MAAHAGNAEVVLLYRMIAKGILWCAVIVLFVIIQFAELFIIRFCPFSPGQPK